MAMELENTTGCHGRPNHHLPLFAASIMVKGSEFKHSETQVPWGRYGKSRQVFSKIYHIEVSLVANHMQLHRQRRTCSHHPCSLGGLDQFMPQNSRESVVCSGRVLQEALLYNIQINPILKASSRNVAQIFSYHPRTLVTADGYDSCVMRLISGVSVQGK